MGGFSKVRGQESVSISPEKSITVSQKRNTQKKSCKKLYVSKLQVLP